MDPVPRPEPACAARPPRPGALGGPRERTAVLLLALAATGLAALFSGKPFHLDDPSFVQASLHVAGDPLRPFDFAINLGDRALPAAEVFASPPGFFYPLALLHELGLRERGIHLALAPLFGWLVLGTAAIARGLGLRPAVPALLVAASPAALVCATNVMPDLFAAAAGSAGVAAWLEGNRRASPLRLLVGGALLVVSTLSRYSAFAAVAALAAYAVVRRARLRVAWAALALAPIALVFWLWRGEGATVVGSLTQAGWSRGHAERALAMASHLGLACAAPAFSLLAGGGALPRTIGWGLPVALLLGAAAPRGLPSGFLRFLPVALAATVGAGFLARGIAGVLRPGPDRSARADSLLLATWLVLSLALPVFYVHASAKYLVTALPAAAVAAARWSSARPRPLRSVPVAAGFLALGLATALADFRLARAHRRLAAEEVAGLVAGGRRVWLAAQWGFRWYGEAAGARPYDRTDPPERGDLILGLGTQIATTIPPRPREGRLTPVEAREVHDPYPFRVMSVAANAGFYSNATGLLPVGVSRGPVEVLYVSEVR